MIRFLLFDLDETLFDFRRAERTSLSRTLSRWGHPPAEEDLDRYNRINIAWWQKLERGEITREEVIVGRFGEFLASFAPSLPADRIAPEYEEGLKDCGFLKPDAEGTLERLEEEGYLLYAVTNGSGDIQRRRLALSGIGRYFRDVFISEELGHEKPSPAYFDAVFRRIPGFSREEAVLIGDSLTSDILGALNAGVTPVWLSPAGSLPQGHPPVRIIRSLREICPRQWEQ